MCGTSGCGSLKREECILERAIEDNDYVAKPFPKEAFEPLEWQQILATLDVCAIKTCPTTQFCDEEGFDVVPYYMMSVIKEETEGQMCEENSKEREAKEKSLWKPKMKSVLLQLFREFRINRGGRRQ